MAYTRAFIQEIIRYCPVTPISASHAASQDAKLMGFDIPKGTQVSGKEILFDCRRCNEK